MTPLAKPISRVTAKQYSGRPVVVTLAPLRNESEALIGLRLLHQTNKQKGNTVMKWSNSTSDPAGKIQVGRFNKQWSELDRENYVTIEKRGIIGQTDGYNAESSYAITRFAIGGENEKRADVEAAKAALGGKYEWTLSRSNCAQVCAEIEAALPALVEARKVDDQRETAEANAKRVATEKANNEAHEAARKNKEQAEIAHFIAEYGSGETYTLAPGQKAVVAQLCFDNSDGMSDYHDSHARLGPCFIIGILRGSRETEAEARRCAEAIASLSDAQHGWTWRTEQYSGGHGNYLSGAGVDVPEVLGATRQAYGSSGAIKRGHWEIQFSSRNWNSGTDNERTFHCFRGFDPAAKAAAPTVTAANGQLGEVAFNEAHNGVEIAFAEKPSDALRDSLKRAGFRITRRPPWKWYQKFSESAWAKACELAGVSKALPKVETPDRFDMEVEDRMAQACGL